MLALRRAAAAAPKRAAIATPFQTASFSDIWKDNERAAEAAFFNKEDEKALRKLLKKLKGQADKNDAAGLKNHVEHDKQGLKNLGLKLTPEQEEALLKWKHEH
ncbi:hypothetical protein PINS_up014972 [Pythium insidiosum]|nr:hypothetical protein PINS_up014972 [Pythium insidiosum]